MKVKQILRHAWYRPRGMAKISVRRAERRRIKRQLRKEASRT